MIKVLENELEVLKFPDGTPKITLSPICDSIGENTDTVSIIWNFENMEEMFNLYCATKHLRRKKSFLPINLFLYYIPNARMDRVKTDKEVFTLKYFCDFINSLNFNTVTVLDPHSDVSVALLNNVIVQSPKYFIRDVCENIEKNENQFPIVLFPDAGALKRYSSCVSEIGMEIMGYADKQRDWETGKIKGIEICGDIKKDNPILIVDDICSYGGTFYHICKKLKEMGAGNVYLYVTHCENSVLKGDLIESNLFKLLFTTKTIFTGKHEKVKVI